jgi:hypothetical protein
MRTQSSRAGVVRLLLPVIAVATAVVACTEQQPLAVKAAADTPLPSNALQAFDCTGSTISRSMSCRPASGSAGGASGVILSGQNTVLKLTSSNVSYTAADSLFSFDVTVQNLLNEAIGTPDGVVADPQGIQVFFREPGPVATSGSGSITVANADGVGTFLGTNESYYQYSEILAANAVSGAKTWQLKIPPSVISFTFKVYVETDVQYKLVINEVLANPSNAASPTVTDATGEWFELYNAGSRPVNLQNLVIADSAASGRRPYHLINTSLVVPPGGYVVLGNTTNTTTNGGVPVDYAYGAALALANSLDAVKIARVYGTDTLTLDRTQYSSAAISAQDGISRELKNPALDNSNMDGSNWGDASVTSVYGPGGRGTPKAQNSAFTP